MFKKIQNLRRYVPGRILAILMLASVACESSNSDPAPTAPTTPVSAAVATDVAVMDIANTGDASDVQLTFRSPFDNANIGSFRALMVKSSSVTTFSIDDANALSSDSYFDIPKTSAINYSLQMPAGLKDSDGENVAETISYVTIIMSIADGTQATVNALSTPSSELTLVKQPEISTLVSDFPANDGLSIDEAGNIYASDFGVWSSTGGSGSKIFKITPQGDVTEFATGLHGPLGNIPDGQGNLLVVDDNNGTRGKIVRISTDQSVQDLAEIPGWPAGIALDENDNIYVSNYQQATIHKLTPQGQLSVLAEDQRLLGAVGIVYDGSNFLYAANYNDGTILKIDLNGQVDLITKINVVQNFGIGYMTLLGDQLYATGIGDHNVYKISLDGKVEVLAGNGTGKQSDGLSFEAGFASPNGITADPGKNVLYISDFASAGLRKIQLF